MSALAQRNHWHEPPTRPMRWNEPNPLAHGLVSLLYYLNGTWFEAGPYGGAGLVVSSNGTVGQAYAPLEQGIGPKGRAALYATQGATAGDGFRVTYPGPLASVTDPLTVFAMAYGPATGVAKVAVGYYNSGVTTFVAGVRFGDGSSNLTNTSFQHAGSVSSSRVNSALYSANVPYFVSGAKVPNSATAPFGAQNGVTMTGTGTNQNANWIAVIQEAFIGRSVAGTLNGGVVMGGMYNRALTIEEQIELYRNPWQLVRPRRGNLFSFAPSTLYSRLERNHVRGLLRGVAR